MVVMIDTVEADLKDAQVQAAPHVAALKAENERADDLLARIYDELWNDLGRPAHERALALVFPGGVAYYADGDTGEQPQRMELLAQLLERGIHPKLPATTVQEAAKRVRGGAASLQKVLDDGKIPSARVTLFERIRTATGRSAQFELASLKRSLKNAGLSETEIHAIIPDRSPPPAKKTDAKRGDGKTDAPVSGGDS